MVPCGTTAWRIESYFKLLKSAGLQLEEWQQATVERIFRRY